MVRLHAFKDHESFPKFNQLTRCYCRMSKVSDTYKWDEMCSLTVEDMDNLLLFYPADKVPSMDILLALRGGNDVRKLDVFDGSFGFSVGA